MIAFVVRHVLGEVEVVQAQHVRHLGEADG